ncbi:MAG: ribonuclease III [Candidatus Parabeggiatoa sp. nov. 2]|nr:MAG: ribonuclease III [Beggiatoa sp. 4572_84]RKZ51628.1 MAG: ribonuclease III [Gammaproteobacteria bacterium]HEC84832.1 ribonuclease III [Thioploca sp.]
MNQDYTRLCQALGYRFKQEDYLTTALTHRSAGTPHNERLEFLGDALLSCIMAEALFERFPASREGELTRLRANLVKRDTLVKIAQRLELGQYLRLGEGELKTGGEGRASILADGVEAIIGAIYRDSGMQTCQSVVLQLWEKSLSNLSLRQIKDPKTRLQEYLQAKQQALPVYRVLAIGGTPHAQQFKVECLVPGLPQPTYGGGESRRRAEQSAAAQALGVLNVE